MGIKEDVLALADELDGVSTKENCDACLASGTELCRGDLECAESAHKACAKRLREIVEHDECEVTTVSAYDLLSEEDREAIAWVHEMGGVNALSRGFQDADNRRIELCSSLGIDLETGWADAMVAMRRRLMPEGMEWPKYTDGSHVEIGDEVVGPDYGERINVNAVKLNAKRFRLYDSNGCGKWYEREDRFERPPVAADGEPLEVGQTVWHVGNGVEFTVVGLPNPGEYQAVKLRLDDGAFTGLDPDQLTHQRPVLDADGVPIKVGDTVWDIETGCGRTVRAVNDNETVEFDGHENRGWFGRFLTHRAPVLAADGEPLREGEHVYHVETGAELVVKKLPNPGEYQAVVVFALPTSPASHLTSFDPDLLTHRAPVFAADGMPLEAGQTVWRDDGEMLEVLYLRPDGLVDCCGEIERPERLTHERPESWERLEEDATKNPYDYCKDVGHRLDTCENSEAYKARDLVRRAKKLAGVDND